MANSPLVTFRATGELGPHLTNRSGTPGAIASRDLGRYYSLLDEALALAHLTEPEWNFLRDILNGSLRDERTANYLWAAVADAEPATAEKWGVDTAELSARLQRMPPLSRLAIVDAVDRWWGEQPPS